MLRINMVELQEPLEALESVKTSLKDITVDASYREAVTN
jgi:hypothetical protein